MSLSVPIHKLANVAVVCVLFIVLVGAYWRQWQGPLITYSAGIESSTPRGVPDYPPPGPIQSLLEALRKAIRKVEQNTGLIADSDFDFEPWSTENPCMSRSELGSIYSRLIPSPHRKEVLTSEWESRVMWEYAKLHRLCTRAAGNLTEYFVSRNASTGCKFMVADAANGMGNKIFIMAPALLYSVLTQRVFLLPVSTGVPDLMCEPFPGSSWKLRSDIVRDNLLWNQTTEFLENVDRAKREHESTMPIYASRIDDRWQPITRYATPHPKPEAGAI